MQIFIYVIASVFFVFYRYFYSIGNFGITMLLKIILSTLFVINGILCFYKNKTKSPVFNRYGKKLIAAFIFSLLSDILIKVNLVAGIVSFLIVQILFFVAFLEYGKITLKFIILLFAIVAGGIIMELNVPFSDVRPLIIPVCFYILALVSGTLKSTEAFKYKNKFATMTAIGSIFFLISDFILQLSLPEISKLSPMQYSVSNTICNVFYYVAQFLMGAGLSYDYIAPFSESQKN